MPALVGVVMFSFTAPTTKLVLGDTSVLFTSAGRVALAGLVAAAVLLAAQAPLPQRADWPRLGVVTAGVGVGFPFFNSLGLHTVPSSHGAIVTALLPLATAGVGAVITGERPSRRYWTCSAVGLAAVTVFVVGSGGGSVRAGDLLLALAVGAAAFGYANGAVLSTRLPGWQVICWTLVAALPLSLPLAGVGLGGAGAPNGAGHWAAFVYTAIGSQLVGFFFWYRGMALAGIARAGQTQLLQPVLSLVWAWPLVGEPLTPAAVATAVVVVGAVAVGRRAPIVAPPAPAAPLAAARYMAQGAPLDPRGAQ